jgi:hypothetical protein
MFHIFPYVAGVALACFVIWEVKKMYRDYPKFKQAVAQGDLEARPRLYMQILRFEWLSALLALVALGFDKTKLMAATLHLGDTAFGRWISETRAAGNSQIFGGIVAGLLIGVVLLTVMRLRARRHAPAAAERVAEVADKSWWRRLVPDITTLIPTTGRERLVFCTVAISAGVCEEIVFRGWLLSVLHSPLGLTGTTLVLVAAALFGLCHVYQGPTGVIGTTVAGVLLTAFYVATGTLLAPIVLHALIDLRMAVLPSNRPQVMRAQAA